MSNEAENLSKFLHFTETLCTFADKVGKHYDCLFNIEISDDKFQFDLPELVAEIRKSRQVLIDDIENCPDDEQGDEITMSDFDYFRKDMPDTVKKLFDLLLPISIIEEENGHKKLSEPMPKEKRIKAIEMHTMLRLAQIAVS